MTVALVPAINRAPPLPGLPLDPVALVNLKSAEITALSPAINIAPPRPKPVALGTMLEYENIMLELRTLTLSPSIYINPPEVELAKTKVESTTVALSPAINIAPPLP